MKEGWAAYVTLSQLEPTFSQQIGEKRKKREEQDEKEKKEGHKKREKGK